MKITQVKKFEIQSIEKRETEILIIDWMGNQHTIPRTIEGNVPLESLTPETDILLMMTKTGSVIKWKVDCHPRYHNFRF